MGWSKTFFATFCEIVRLFGFDKILSILPGQPKDKCIESVFSKCRPSPTYILMLPKNSSEVTLSPTYIIAVHIQMKTLFAVKDFAQKQLFWIRWPLEAKPLTWGQIWRNFSDGQFNSLSNAVFRFALAIIVPEIMKIFRKDVLQLRKKSKISPFFGPGGHNFDLSEKLTEIVS